MPVLIRAELYKLRTTRIYYGLLAIAAGLTLLVEIVLAGRSGASSLLPSLTAVASARSISEVIALRMCSTSAASHTIRKPTRAATGCIRRSRQ